MEEYIICSDGGKRKAIRITCKNCGKEVLQRITRKSVGKFCSKTCCSTYQTNTKSVDLVCRWCDKIFRRKQSNVSKSRSGLHFCTRACKDEAQKLGGVKEIQPSHFGTRTREKPKTRRNPNGKSHRRLFKPEELVCIRCGYKEFLCSVDVHHIDFDHKNNIKENLLPLCANCHRGLHYNKWKLEDLLNV